MRLHELTVTAFGPFAGTERVDFRELNEAGLFLLCGATGAGKSSLLDAVCFALYGSVPGARGVKTLKSQHAAADAKPEVVLDFTVAGRRLVLRRSPEWTRPKRRGDGTTAEKASASLVETTGGVERFLTARAAEVGLLVGELMGVSADQFQQVALLPQGEFQRFLRASSQERHDVLQRLFRTDRFSRIEDFVADHSRALRSRAETGRTSVERLLDAVAERSGILVPEELVGDRLVAATAQGRPVVWVGDVLDVVEAEAAVARDQHEQTDARHRAAAERLDAASRLAERRERRADALAALASLAESEPEAALARERLTAHDRAEQCRPVLALHRQALAEDSAALTARDRALRELSPPDRDPHDQQAGVCRARLARGAEHMRGRIARLEALLPREQAALEASRLHRVDLDRLRAAQEELVAAAARAAGIPEEIDAVTASLEAAAVRAARHDTLAESLRGARDRHAAAVELSAVDRRLLALEDAARDARDRMQDAREALQALVARRLAGMAAELAGQLSDGAACLVCGSTDHPEPATPAEDAVTELDQRTADEHFTAMAAAHDAAQQAVRAEQRHQDTLSTACGGSDAAVAARQSEGEIVRLEAALQDAALARDETVSLQGALDDLRREQRAVSEQQTAAAATAAGRRESASAHARIVEAVAAEIAAVLGDHDAAADGPAVEVGNLRTRLAALVRAEHALATHERAADHLRGVAEQVAAALGDHGFAAVPDVDRALLHDAQRADLEASLRRRGDLLVRAQAVLTDPELADLELTDPELTDSELTDSEPADPGLTGHDTPVDLDEDGARHLGALAAAAAAADAATQQAAGVRVLHEDRARAVRSLLERLVRTVEDWAPIRDESLRAESLARLVRGTGSDNALQLRLSAYVLATRLDQVVAAANERLGHLRDQRYLLQRTGRAERRGSQAGLGLEVVDQWTGDVRTPATLSGGETFVVSLSLALGLADVVTHEAGGTEIETLFVDEGFGMLDADTLDDVMDRLDGLRAGGRTVGIVSHVAELRSRISTQVQVDKGRTGSRVTVRTLVR